MSKLFTVIGWVLIAGGLLGAVVAYSVVGSQDFVVALLARVVEDPFAYRSLAALGTAVMVAVGGCLTGALYLGLGEVLRRGEATAGDAG